MPESRSLARLFTDAVDAFNDRLGAGLRWLALVMVVIGAYNAVARYLTRYTGTQLSSNALNELQWYLFSVIFLLGAAYGLHTDAHVRVDVLYSRLSRKGRAWIDLLGGVLFLLPFSLLMLQVSWPAVRNSWSILETSPDPGGLPRYPIKALILVSFGLLVVQGVRQIIGSVRVLRGWEEGGGGSDGPDGGGFIPGSMGPGGPGGTGDSGGPDSAGRRGDGVAPGDGVLSTVAGDR